MEFSKLIVAAVIILNTFFTVGVLYVFLRVGSEPMALIAAWFAFTTGELWLLAGLKKTKVKAETRQIISEYPDVNEKGEKQ